MHELIHQFLTSYLEACCQQLKHGLCFQHTRHTVLACRPCVELNISAVMQLCVN